MTSEAVALRMATVFNEAKFDLKGHYCRMPQVKAAGQQRVPRATL